MNKVYFLTLMLLVFIACKSTKEIQNKGNLSIYNQWILEKFDRNSDLIHNKNCYVTIGKEGTLQGKSVCNRISGKCEISKNSILFSNIMSTKMHCGEESTIETEFNECLRLSNSYKIVGGELFLYQNGKLLMTLESFRG